MSKNKPKAKAAAPKSAMSHYSTEALKARVYDLSSVVQHASKEIEAINQELGKRAMAPKVDNKKEAAQAPKAPAKSAKGKK